MRNTRLQAARERCGKTQAQVARAAGLTEQAYQRYEYGTTEPRVRTAIRIADALNVVDLREIFADIDNDSTKCDGRQGEKGA